MIDTRTAPYAALTLRVALGVMFLAHSLYLKVFVFTVPGTVGFFESLGLPAIAAYLTIFAEIAGGIALILGIQTRLVSVALLPVLLGATWVHAGNGWLFSAEGGGWEYPVFLAAAAVVQALLGDGAHAVKLPFFGQQKPAPQTS
ncbi:DoxX family protein [Pelagibius sp.]|uniref:DoxX family protein n=1 Tax=Pelagibius sp. TaxID=1931238 RepID=UPI003B50EC98